MHVLLVEDDPDMRGLIKAGLEASSFQVTACPSAERALAVLGGTTFDLLLLDLELPGRSGLSVLQEVRRRRNPAPVIIITGGRTATEDRVRGLDAGADDYLIKPFPLPELLARIRAVRRRAAAREAAELRVGDLGIDPARRVVVRGGVEIELTAREYELLEYLARHAGEVVDRERLALDVWREPRRATTLDNVIDVHISHLRRKIDDGHASKLLQTVRGAGFVLRA